MGVGAQIRQRLLHQLLAQAQVLYINLDFPTFDGVNLRHESKLGCTRIQKLLGFGLFIFAII